MITPEELKEKTLERVWKKIKFGEPDQCWEWQATRNNKGYGKFYIRTGVQSLAHRYVFTQLFGEVPKNIQVCHSCDNPRCTNPNHLFSGTHKDNMDDLWKKGRGRKGSKHGNSKLKEKDIPIIRQRLKNGEFHKSISESFGISRTTITYISNGLRWKHVI